MSSPEARDRLSARRTVFLYLALAGVGHLLWETAQVPLYTIWWTGTERRILFAVIHCTGGDLLISAAALGLAALGARTGHWPLFGGRMALTAIVLGLGYTVLSEWLNTQIRQTWSYTAAMPLLPPLGTGLAPFLQWLVVPGVAFAIAACWGRSPRPARVACVCCDEGRRRHRSSLNVPGN